MGVEVLTQVSEGTEEDGGGRRSQNGVTGLTETPEKRSLPARAARGVNASHPAGSLRYPVPPF